MDIVCVNCKRKIGEVNCNFELVAPYLKTRKALISLDFKTCWVVCEECSEKDFEHCTDLLLKLREEAEKEAEKEALAK
jgi:hypothetical protein